LKPEERVANCQMTHTRLPLGKVLLKIAQKKQSTSWER
jgi:hypothetical protein